MAQNDGENFIILMKFGTKYKWGMIIRHAKFQAKSFKTVALRVSFKKSTNKTSEYYQTIKTVCKKLLLSADKSDLLRVWQEEEP